MISCVLLTMFIGACAEQKDGSSVQGGQTETVVPASTRTIKQMEEYEKTHPPSKEQRVMPMPGSVADQIIDGQPHSDSKATGL